MIYRKRNETDLQINVADWLRRQYPRALWTISPSGMKLGKRVAMRFKAMGYRKGTPDIMIFEPRGLFHGMFLELKMPGGKASDEQKVFKVLAEDNCYWCAICPVNLKTEQECFEWAINCINTYMTLSTSPKGE